MHGAKVITMNLSRGQDWLWYPDLNTVALSPHLDAEGRERALDELQACWRRALLTAVPESA